MGFAAEEVFFGGGGKEAIRSKKGVRLHPQALDFQEINILRKLNIYCKLLQIRYVF